MCSIPNFQSPQVGQSNLIKIGTFSLGVKPQHLTDDKSRVNGLMASPSKLVLSFQTTLPYQAPPPNQQTPKIYSSNPCVIAPKRRVILRHHSNPLMQHQSRYRHPSLDQDCNSNNMAARVHYQHISLILPENNKLGAYGNCDGTELRRDGLAPNRKPPELLPSIPLSAIGGFDNMHSETYNHPKSSYPVFLKHRVNPTPTAYAQITREDYPPRTHKLPGTFEAVVPASDSHSIPSDLLGFAYPIPDSLLRSCTSSLECSRINPNSSESISSVSQKPSDESFVKLDMEPEVSSCQTNQRFENDDASRTSSGIYFSTFSNEVSSRSSMEDHPSNTNNLSMAPSTISSSPSCNGADGLPKPVQTMDKLLKQRSSLLQQIVQEYNKVIGLMHEEIEITGLKPYDFERTVDNYELALDALETSRPQNTTEADSAPKIRKSSVPKGSSFCLSPRFIRQLSAGSLQNIVQAQEDERKRHLSAAGLGSPQTVQLNVRAKSIPRDILRQPTSTIPKSTVKSLQPPPQPKLRKWFSLKSVKDGDAMCSLPSNFNAKSQVHSLEPCANGQHDLKKLQQFLIWKNVEIATVRHILEVNIERSKDTSQTMKSRKAYQKSANRNRSTLKKLEKELLDLRNKQTVAERCKRSASTSGLPPYCRQDEVSKSQISLGVDYNSDTQHQALHSERTASNVTEALSILEGPSQEKALSQLYFQSTPENVGLNSSESYSSFGQVKHQPDGYLISSENRPPHEDSTLISSVSVPIHIRPATLPSSSVISRKTVALSTSDLHAGQRMVHSAVSTAAPLGSLEKLSVSALTPPVPRRSLNSHYILHDIPISLSTSTMSDTTQELDNPFEPMRYYGRPNYRSKFTTTTRFPAAMNYEDPMRSESMNFSPTPTNQSINLRSAGEVELLTSPSNLLGSPHNVVLRNSFQHSPNCAVPAARALEPQCVPGHPKATAVSAKQFSPSQPISELDKLTNHALPDLNKISLEPRITLADKFKMTTSSFHW